MTTAMHLVILLEQACRLSAHADPALAARHQRIAVALIGTIKKESRRGDPAATSWTAIPFTRKGNQP